MKIIVVTTMIAVTAVSGYFGYIAYERATMTDVERMIMANLEALTNGEELTNGENNDTYCYSGGVGATSCSIDSGIEILGCGVSIGCFVTCSGGYYACCGMRCTCIQC